MTTRPSLRDAYGFRVIRYGFDTTKNSVRQHIWRWITTVLIAAMAIVLAAILVPPLVGQQVNGLALSVGGAVTLAVIFLGIDIAMAPSRLDRDLRARVATLEAGPERVVDVRVRAGAPPLRPIDSGDSAREAWLAQERDRLLKPLREWQQEEKRRRRGGREPSVNEVLANAAADLPEGVERMAATYWNVLGTSEDQSPDEYVKACDAYIDAMRDRWMDTLGSAAAETELSPLNVEMVNTSRLHQPDVQLIIIAPREVRAFSTTTPDWYGNPLPEPPPRWMSRPHHLGGMVESYLLTGLVGPPPDVTVVTTQDARATMEYAAVDLRPDLLTQLDPVWLSVPASVAGGSLRFDYEVRGRDITDKLRGFFEVAVADEPVLPFRLLMVADAVRHGETDAKV